MASSGPQKIYIQVETPSEQQENMKNARKTSKALAVLQKTGAIDKENLIGRQTAQNAKELLIRKTIESELSQTPDNKRKVPAPNTASSSAQTSPSIAPSSSKVVAADLTSDTPGEHYWEVLAEKRRVALDESLVENQELYERIAVLEDELNQSKTMLAEARHLVEVLTEMLEEKDSPTEESAVEEEKPNEPKAESQDNEKPESDTNDSSDTA